ncbi:MAG: hypothetical protein R2939_06235 [Kofleriaceae bacterium]
MRRGISCAVLGGALGLAGCGAAAVGAPMVASRPGCAAGQRWDGAACVARGDDAERIAAAREALAGGGADLDRAEALLAGLAEHGPLDYASHVALWEQRGILAGYLDDAAGAEAAFRELLTLAPDHTLRHTLSPKVTLPFERARRAVEERGAPAVDVTWRRDQRVGSPVAVEVERVADPTELMARVDLYLRERGADAWKVVPVPLRGAPRYQSLRLPPARATADTGLELYAIALDADDNEVARWSDPRRPREVPLRYVAPTPWYRRWWVWTLAGTAAAAAAAGTAWALTREPPDEVPIEALAPR